MLLALNQRLLAMNRGEDDEDDLNLVSVPSSLRYYMPDADASKSFKEAPWSDVYDLAITDESYFIIYDDDCGLTTTFLPPSSSPEPYSMALGLNRQYAVITNGPPDLVDTLNKYSSVGIRSIAMGRRGGWCVALDDGDTAWSTGYPSDFITSSSPGHKTCRGCQPWP